MIILVTPEENIYFHLKVQIPDFEFHSEMKQNTLYFQHGSGLYSFHMLQVRSHPLQLDYLYNKK